MAYKDAARSNPHKVSGKDVEFQKHPGLLNRGVGYGVSFHRKRRARHKLQETTPCGRPSELAMLFLLLTENKGKRTHESHIKDKASKPTISIHVIITGVSFSISISVFLVIIQDIPAVVTGVPKDIFVTVPLVHIVSQDTVILKDQKTV